MISWASASKAMVNPRRGRSRFWIFVIRISLMLRRGSPSAGASGGQVEEPVASAARRAGVALLHRFLEVGDRARCEFAAPGQVGLVHGLRDQTRFDVVDLRGPARSVPQDLVAH